MKPKSLFGRMILVLIFGLVLGQFLSTIIYLYERHQILFNTVWTQAAERISTQVKYLDTISVAERKKLVFSMSAAPLLVSIPEKQATSRDYDASDEDFLENILQQNLGAQREIRIFSVDRSQFFGTDNASFGVDVRLKDGMWLQYNFVYSKPNLYLSHRLFIEMGVISSILLALSFFAVRLVTRPLNILAQAAEELGGNLNRPPLPVDGPIEVSRAARAFNTMQARLLEYVESRARVHAALSHDLKTPITRMILRAELLDDPEIKEKFLRDLEDMHSMVSTHLDLMRGIGTGENSCQVNMNALLESIADDLRELGGTVNITGYATKNYPGKPQSLKRAISNLVENAIKYGQMANIRVEDSERELIIRIIDHGPGIPEGEIERVFEPFYRLESSRNRDTGGYGLGLAISRGVAQIHGGNLLLLNRKEGGLEAILSLPR